MSQYCELKQDNCVLAGIGNCHCVLKQKEEKRLKEISDKVSVEDVDNIFKKIKQQEQLEYARFIKYQNKLNREADARWEKDRAVREKYSSLKSKLKEKRLENWTEEDKVKYNEIFRECIQESTRIKDKEYIDLLFRYYYSKRNNSYEEWSKVEYEEFYNNMKFLRTGSIEFRKGILRTAISLERTLKAVAWKYRYMFLISKKHNKEGQILTDFKRDKKIRIV